MKRTHRIGAILLASLSGGCLADEALPESVESETSGILWKDIVIPTEPLPPLTETPPTSPGDGVCIPGSADCAPDPGGFLVRAYAGQIVKNGGKCLDYHPGQIGTPLFLNDCAKSHAIHVVQLKERVAQDGCTRKHEVRLLAGNDVIGVSMPPPGSAEPPVLTLQARPLPKFGPRWLDNQTFVLDGDSIIFAADRDKPLNSDSTTLRVAQVENGRGANGSRIVLAQRGLGDHEFFEFHAVDGSGRDPGCAYRNDPACGFVHVEGRQGLVDYLAQGEVTTCELLDGRPKWPDYDKVIIIETPTSPERQSDLPETLLITDGVTIRGDRRGTRLGPQLGQDEMVSHLLFSTRGNDIRFTGLRMQGPTREKFTDVQAQAIKVSERLRNQDGTIASLFSRIYIDHNDMSQWSLRAVWVTADDPGSEVEGGEAVCKFTDPVPVGSQRRNRVTVARNFIHHNKLNAKGYGVNANSGAFPLIEGNTFVWNRHAIAGTNPTPETGYRAWGNLVLSDAPSYAPFYQSHDFDMHGSGNGDHGRCGDGGGDTDIAWNTFLGDDRTNYELRADPCGVVEFRRNVSLHSKDDTVRYDLQGYCSGSDSPIAFADNQFDRPDPTNFVGTGDFDGDGRTDLFLATGAAFYYAPGGAADWRLLAWGRTDQISELRFGDFDGDGRTDVIAPNGADLMVSWGGASAWERLMERPAPMADLAVGNFNGVGPDDIFWADGASWHIAYDGAGPFVRIGASSFKVAKLRFGDLNDNGTTDVFGVGPDQWRYSDGGTVKWTYLGERRADIANLFIGDFDGDGRDDVGRVVYGTSGHKYEYSRSGTAAFAGIVMTAQPFAAWGRFASPAQTGLLFWDSDEHLDLAYAGSGGLVAHSRQDMR